MSRHHASSLTDAQVEKTVSRFGHEVSRKLRTRHGSSEDHLRGPFEQLLSSLAGKYGLDITTVGEARLPDLSVRPDYAIDVAGARVGYVELKKPGHGVPGAWPNPSKHDREQWKKLQLLPNVLYSDGQQFARFSFGQLQGRIARLDPELDRAGSRLHPVDGDFTRVLSDFLLWVPERPRSLTELVRLIARLCRLLRDDVAAEFLREQSGGTTRRTFTSLATDWRQVLFPNLTDQQFADQYSQTITFALLLARVEGVSFNGRSITEIARLLGKKHSLMGRALTVLTDQPEEEHSVALTTMIRVLSVVDWSDFPDDSYAQLYEMFLTEYDPALRRKSGVYYTPSALVSFMTRFVDDVLRTRLDRDLGFAERDVIVVDPAMGTGSFLAEVVNTVAATVADSEGPGAVAPRLRDLFDRLIGFENQAAPYAVAELRLHSLLRKRHRAEVPDDERRFLADTLDDPYLQQLPMGKMYDVLRRSRDGANRVKREVPVMVVIGNPPYVDKVKNSSEWIEQRSSRSAAPSLAAFRRPRNGKREYVLSNKYVYFWRWATWKAFDAHPEHPAGVVAFVCSAGFTTGAGFAGMREYLRRTADEGWIIDLTPEGHQPPMSSRFFRGNQQPICVAIFIRTGQPSPNTPARIRRLSVTGSVDQKAAALGALSMESSGWTTCMRGWTDPLRPAGRDLWSAMPATTDLMPWTAPGVKPNRTWVYAPEEATLRDRWERLVSAGSRQKPDLLKETISTKVDTIVRQVAGMVDHRGAIRQEEGHCPAPRRVSYRSFDRQWVVPDARVHHRPSPPLWSTYSRRQIFVIEQHTQPIGAGPALVFTSLLPDMDCFMGHHGGRVLPLYRDVYAYEANLAPGLLEYLTGCIGLEVAEIDLVAYMAAVTAHPGFVRRFAADLAEPGVRVPITREAGLWDEAVRVGREILWLHTYGERCADPADGRPQLSPRIQSGGPTVQVAIPDTEDRMPESISYDELAGTLHVGDGEITPVPREVWNYEVSGMPVIRHWFGYRKKRPSGRRSSPLDDIVATRWTATMTTELLELLNVLGRCVALEPRQDELLGKVLDGPLITIDDLTASRVLPVPSRASVAPTPHDDGGLFVDEQ